MARHSKFERERREAETERVKQIEAAWMGSLPTATAKAFAESVALARARGPEEKRPDMAPGTAPRPPRPGHEPKPPKDERPASFEPRLALRPGARPRAAQSTETAGSAIGAGRRRGGPARPTRPVPPSPRRRQGVDRRRGDLLVVGPDVEHLVARNVEVACGRVGIELTALHLLSRDGDIGQLQVREVALPSIDERVAELRSVDAGHAVDLEAAVDRLRRIVCLGELQVGRELAEPVRNSVTAVLHSSSVRSPSRRALELEVDPGHLRREAPLESGGVVGVGDGRDVGVVRGVRVGRIAGASAPAPPAGQAAMR